LQDLEIFNWPWVHPQYNEPNPTPLFLLKGQGFEVEN
jgi:hypothetical protein